MIFAWINYSWPLNNLGIRVADPPLSNNLSLQLALPTHRFNQAWIQPTLYGVVL